MFQFKNDHKYKVTIGLVYTWEEYNDTDCIMHLVNLIAPVDGKRRSNDGSRTTERQKTAFVIWLDD